MIMNLTRAPAKRQLIVQWKCDFPNENQRWFKRTIPNHKKEYAGDNDSPTEKMYQVLALAVLSVSLYFALVCYSVVKMRPNLVCHPENLSTLMTMQTLLLGCNTVKS